MKYLSILVMLGLSQAAWASEAVVDSMLKQYQAEGAGEFDASRGEQLWQQKRMQPKMEKMVNCASCHTDNLRQSGSHMRTGKVIEPLSPTANPKRLTDPAHIEKWFLRNCKWTLGRECTVQEKGDFLLYIQSK